MPNLKAISWTFFFLGALVATTLVVVMTASSWYWQQFSVAAQTPRAEFFALVKEGWNTKPKSNLPGYTTILLLGIDSLNTRGDIPPLTDTIALISVDHNSGRIKMLSLPRDIWSNKYQTRINALYAYSFLHTPNNPTLFPTESLVELTGANIDYTFVLSMDQVEQLIDQVGGIEIEIKTGFVDHEFPRTDVYVTQELDPEKLYETVIFEAGAEHMSGSRALKYIRSRHSGDDEGTDLARGQRQQQVIQALISQLMNKKIFLNPRIAGQLFQTYRQNFDQSMPIVDSIGLMKNLIPYRDQIELVNFSLPVYPQDEAGIIYHPPTSQTNGQWVYNVKNVEDFQKYIMSALYE